MDELIRLKRMLNWPDMQHTRDTIKHDTIKRRIFAIEHEIAFSNPFNEVDETLYRIGGRQ